MKKSRGRTGVIWIDQLKSCAPSRSADTETLLTGYKSLVIKDKKIYIFSLSDNILRSKLTRKKSLCYPFTQLLSVSATFLHSTAEYRCVTAKSEKNKASRVARWRQTSSSAASLARSLTPLYYLPVGLLTPTICRHVLLPV